MLDLRNASRATDGTRKYLFHTHDGHAIETVMIPEKGRHTVCISTQVGCPMACKFCATGLLGIKRNLKAREIAEQVFVAARDIAPERVSNVVVMGMGEPMLNYDETLKALKVLNDPDGFGLAARHIAVSTSGLIDKIRRFADEPEQFHLAISLHTPFEDERGRSCRSPPATPIAELMDAARYYVDTDPPQALLRVHAARRRERPAPPRRGAGRASGPPPLPPEPPAVQLDGHGLLRHLQARCQGVLALRQGARALGDAAAEPGPGHRRRLRAARRQGPARPSRHPDAI